MIQKHVYFGQQKWMINFPNSSHSYSPSCTVEVVYKRVNTREYTSGLNPRPPVICVCGFIIVDVKNVWNVLWSPSVPIACGFVL